MDLVLFAAPHGGKAIDLIEENDGGLATTGLLEEESELAFRFSNPFAKTVGAFPHEEGNVLAAFRARGGQGTGEESLPSAGRAGVKEGEEQNIAYESERRRSGRGKEGSVRLTRRIAHPSVASR